MIPKPLPADLKARYPEFTPVSDVLVAAVIGEAYQMVDEGWEEADRTPAILAFAAHLLAMEGWPGRASLGVGAPMPPGAGKEVIMRKVGDVTVQYASSGSGGSSGGGGVGLLSSLALTPYGRRFAQLLKLNAPAIGLV